MWEKLLELLKEPKGILLLVLTAAIGAFFTKFLPWFFRTSGKGIKWTWHLLTGRHNEKRFEKQYLSSLIEKNQFLGMVPTTRVVPNKRGLRHALLEQVYTTLTIAAENQLYNGPAKDFKIHFIRLLGRGISRCFSLKVQTPEESELGELLLKHTRVMIQGDPGSGKTTLLRYLVVTCARALRNENKEGRILYQRLGWAKKPFPIFLSLINLSDIQARNHESLIDLFYAELDPELKKKCPSGFFREKLENVRCLILLDAFDEMGSSEARQAMANKVGELLRICSTQKHVVVATARRVGYESQLDSFGFISFFVQELDEGARIRLVRQRFQAIAVEEGYGKKQEEQEALWRHYESRADRLILQTNRNPHLRQLTYNPLLLTLIVMIDAAGIPMPDQRHELYKDCVDVLVNSWYEKKLMEISHTQDKREIVKREEKKKILAELAFLMQTRRSVDYELALLPHGIVIQVIAGMLRDTFKIAMPKDYLRPDNFYLDVATEMVNDIKHKSGILIEKGFDRDSDPLFAFSHLSFQEYLCATKVSENTDCYNKMVSSLIDPAWQEIILLYRAITGTQDLMEMMISESISQPSGLLLAATCIADYDHGISAEIKDKVSTKLKCDIYSKDRAISPQLLHAYVKIGGREDAMLLLNLIHDQKENDAVRLISALGEMQLEQDAKEELAGKLLLILSQPQRLSFKMRIAIGQAVEKLGDPRITETEPEMVLIPGGKFLYGDEKKPMNLPDFLISKYPITNLQYQRFVQMTGHRQPGNWKEGCYPAGQGNHPVVNVDFYDTAEFCKWLTSIANDRRTYRLPTQIEWEKASRGTDGRSYPWGDKFDKGKCNSFAQNDGTCAIGVFPDGSSPYGICDMAGNVWEWTCTSYYSSNLLKRAISLARKNDRRVVRGGSWRSDSDVTFRCAGRGSIDPVDRSFVIGFRAVCPRS